MFRRAYALLTICVVVQDGVGAPVTGSSAPPREVEGYARQLELMRQVSFDFEAQRYEQGGRAGSDEKLVQIERGSTAVRGDEFRLRSRFRQEVLIKDFMAPSDIDGESIYRDGKRVRLETQYESWPFSFDEGFPDRKIEEYHVVAFERPREHGEIQYLNYSLRLLYGYALGDDFHNILDFFDSPNTVTSEPADVAGRPVVKLTSRGRYGTHQLWLDPAAGYAARRLEVHKYANDLMNKQPVSSIPAHGDPRDRRPDKPWREYHYAVRDVELEPGPLPDQYVMRRFSVYEAEVYQGGETFRVRRQVELSNVHVTTDQDLEPTLPIPEGTPATIFEAPALAAEWRGGQVRRVSDADVVARLKNTRLGKPAPTRWWLIGVNVLVVAGLLTWWVRRRFAMQ